MCGGGTFLLNKYPSNSVSSKSFPQGPRPKVYLVGGGLVELEEGTFKLPWWLLLLCSSWSLQLHVSGKTKNPPWKLSRCHRFQMMVSLLDDAKSYLAKWWNSETNQTKNAWRYKFPIPRWAINLYIYIYIYHNVGKIYHTWILWHNRRASIYPNIQHECG